MALTLLAFYAVICIICYESVRFIMWHFRRRRLYDMASTLDGPSGLPILGCAHKFVGNSEDVLKKLNEYNELYSSPCRFWMGPFLLIMVNDPEQLKEICTNPSTLDKGGLFRHIAGPLVGNGLVTAPVPKWRVHRRLIEPTFNKKILESYVEIFATQAKIFTEQIDKNLDGPEFEIFDLVSSCTLDIVCEAAMGVKMRAQTDKNCYYVQALQKAYASGSTRLFKFWLRPDFIFWRTKLGKEQLKDLKYLHDYADNVIKSRRIEFLKRNSQQAEADNENSKSNFTPRRESYLDLLMKLTDDTGKLSDEELREEVDTMIAGGNDSPSRTLSFVMLMLASHPDVQAKVYEELYQIYGDTNIEERPVLSEDLRHMKYLERVINETLRLFPPGPFILRKITEDVNLGGDCILPKGGSVIIAIMSLHRREDYWPDPLKFDPGRFAPEEIAKRHPYAFMPFSRGPRNCIAINFAMMSMKTVIATTLRKYILKKDHIVPVKDIRLTLQLLMKPADPITLRIKRRTKN